MGHCHHRATGGIDPERTLLEQMGTSVNPLTGGCCGLAGSWGFENGKYDSSLDCGEQALLPAVRKADPATLIVADGFSCKTQIEQAGTGRRALHVAQVMKLAREHGSDVSGLPERAVDGLRPLASTARKAARIGLPVAAAAGVTAALLIRWLTPANRPVPQSGCRLLFPSPVKRQSASILLFDNSVACALV